MQEFFLNQSLVWLSPLSRTSLCGFGHMLPIAYYANYWINPATNWSNTCNKSYPNTTKYNLVKWHMPAIFLVFLSSNHVITIVEINVHHSTWNESMGSCWLSHDSMTELEVFVVSGIAMLVLCLFFTLLLSAGLNVTHCGTCLITLGLWPAATRVVQRRLRSADRQQMVVPSYKTTVQSATALLLKSRTYYRYVSYQYNTCSCQYNSFTYNGLQVLLVKYLYNTIAGQFNTLYSCTIYAMIFYLQIPYYNDFRFYVTGIGLIFQLFVQLQYVSIHYLYYLIYFTYYRFMNQLQIL